MAVERSQGFKNLTINYKQLMSIPVADRVDMVQSNLGRQIMSALTPDEIARAFPRYYSKTDPGVARGIKALSGGGSAGERESEGGVEGTTRRGAPPTEMDLRRRNRGNLPSVDNEPTWMKTIRRETGIDISDPRAKAELTQERKEILERLRTGTVSADDEKIKFLKNVSNDDLKKAGIQRSEDGKSYSLLPITDEQIKERMASGKTISGMPENDFKALREFREYWGMSPQALTGTLRIESGQNIDPRIRGGSRNNYHGIFQLQSEQIPGLTKQALGTALTPDQYRNLSRADQLKVMSQYYRNAGITPGFFTGDPKTDAAKMMALQFAPGHARNFDYNNPNTVITRTKQSSEISASSGVVTVGSAANGVLRKGSDFGYSNPEEAKASIETERQQRLATLGKLPEGIDEGFANVYKNLRPREQAQVLKVIEQKGVEGFNEIYRRSPTAVSQAAVTGEIGSDRFANSLVQSNMRNLTPEAQDSANRFLRYSQSGTITSTFRTVEQNRLAGGVANSQHLVGSAIDVRTNGRSKEQILSDIAALKRAGFNTVLIEKDHLHAERHSNSDRFSVSVREGHTPPQGITLDEARAAAAQAQFNVPLETATRTSNERQTTAPSTPFYFGDSLAGGQHGNRGGSGSIKNDAGGFTQVGASPATLAQNIRNLTPEQLENIKRNGIVISSGTNNPADVASTRKIIEYLKEQGVTDIRVTNVSRNVRGADEHNASLREVAEQTGARLVDVSNARADRFGHPNRSEYAGAISSAAPPPPQTTPNTAQSQVSTNPSDPNRGVMAYAGHEVSQRQTTSNTTTQQAAAPPPPQQQPQQQQNAEPVRTSAPSSDVGVGQILHTGGQYNTKEDELLITNPRTGGVEAIVQRGENVSMPENTDQVKVENRTEAMTAQRTNAEELKPSYQSVVNDELIQQNLQQYENLRETVPNNPQENSIMPNIKQEIAQSTDDILKYSSSAKRAFESVYKFNGAGNYFNQETYS